MEQEHYYDYGIPNIRRLSPSVVEIIENLEKASRDGLIEQEDAGMQISLSRSSQLKDIILEIINDGEFHEEEGGKLDICLCNMEEKLKAKGVELIDPADLSICMELLRRDKKIVTGSIVYAEKGLTVFIAPARPKSEQTN